MAASSSQIRIINGALAELGSTTRITSINETLSGQAQTAKALWAEELADVLESHPWNFAIRRATLNQSSATPDSSYDFQYQLPADLVRWLPWDKSEAEYFDGEEESGFILTNAGTCKIRYIYFNDEVGDWKPSFVKYMKLVMATAMAEAVTQSQSIKDRVEIRMEKQFSKAKRLDGLATGKRKRSGITIRSDWNRARNIPNYHIGH